MQNSEMESYEMLELLNSNYLPIKTKNQEFEKTFYNYLDGAKRLTVASGYISEDSVADLIGLYKTGLSTKLNLIVGMHYFEGFSYGQYDALHKLADILEDKNLGNVYLASSVKYHGKVYLFETQENKRISILGSSNLTKIASSERIYDTDVITDDASFNNNVADFLKLLTEKNCEQISKIDDNRIKILPPNNLFEDYLSVTKVSSNYLAEIQSKKTSVSFLIPLKTEERSNLNCYFGKGRKNFSNGSILPRSWYEVELIVSKSITSLPNYPKENSIFTVVTDDGYKFACKTSGDFSKNFRSAADLKILGRWIKGRMENKKALNIGEKVTDRTFSLYGRNSVTLTKTIEHDIWFLDFGVDK